MATLIAPLVAGFADCPSGTAEFYERGTTAPATVYSDFDATAALTNLTLDASGRLVCYALTNVDVRVRDVSGTLKASFTAGTTAASVDVENDSFIGSLPSGSLGAGGATDLDSVLSLVKSSFGATNFLVRRSGATSDQLLKDALQSVFSANQPFFNVKDSAYGAIGDGVASDYDAIVAAYDAAVAAGGGIVFFPAGTYLINSGLAFTSNKVSYLGVGAQASVLKLGVAATCMSFTGGVTTQCGTFVRNLGLTKTSDGSTAISITTMPGMTFDSVRTSGFITCMATSSRVNVINCAFAPATSVLATNANAITFSAGSDDSLVLGGDFTYDTGFHTGDCFEVSATNVKIVGAHCDFSATSSLNVDVANMNAGSSGLLLLGISIIKNPNSTRLVTRNADVSFFEFGTTATTGVAASISDMGAYTSQALIGSSYLSDVSATSTAYAPAVDIETHNVTAGGNFTLVAPTTNFGTGRSRKVTVLVTNSTGGNITMTFNAAWDTDASATAVLAAGQTRVLEFVKFGTGAVSAANAWTQIGTPVDV